jgi:hypothetical protein
MRSTFIVLFLFLGWMSVSCAEEAVSHSHPLTTFYIARTGEQFQAPHVLTYRLLEFEQMRGRWILPDIGVYDLGHGDFREMFCGAGAMYYHGKVTTLTQEVYFVQDTGAAAHSARYLWVWPIFDFQFKPRLTAQAVVYPHIPLNSAAKVQYDVDRAKLEYSLNRRLTLGGGYSSSKSSGSAWQSEPFLSTTVKSREGGFEFWLQKISGGGQLQVRYMLVHSER